MKPTTLPNCVLLNQRPSELRFVEPGAPVQLCPTEAGIPAELSP